MAEPTKYSIIYEYTGLSNQRFGGSSVGYYRSVAREKFSISGNVSEPIGKILEIDIIHSHTSTNSNYSSKNWSLYTRLVASGTTIATSDTVSKSIQGRTSVYTNKIVENLPSPEVFATWTGLDIVKANNRTDSELYWKATSDYPMQIIVYFWSKNDMVEGADPPVINGLTFSDSIGAYDYFEYNNVKRMVQNRSDITITGLYELDESYEYISGSHTLTITDSNGNTIYSETLSGDKNFIPEFYVGKIDDGGTISILYNVTDNAENSVDYTTTMSMLPYSNPVINAALMERYTINIDDSHELSEDGEMVWMTLNASVQSINGKNGWALTCAYNEEDDISSTTINIDSGQDGENISFNRDEESFDGIIFGADVGWVFDFALTDYFETTHMIVTIDEAGAILNVYSDGVSVGMRGTGDSTHKKFEVASTHPSYLYGGIASVGNSIDSQSALGIQSGYVTFGTVNNGQTMAINVSFDKPFDFTTIPIVVLGLRYNSDSATFGSCSCAVSSKSNAGFTARCFNNSGSVRNNVIGEWIAIGVMPNAEDLNASQALFMLTSGMRYPDDVGDDISDEEALRIITNE